MTQSWRFGAAVGVLIMSLAAPLHSATPAREFAYARQTSLAPGSYGFVFSLYDSRTATTPLWTSGTVALTLRTPLLVYSLGSGVKKIPDSIDFSSQLYLKVEKVSPAPRVVVANRERFPVAPQALWSAAAADLGIVCAPGQFLVVQAGGAWGCGTAPAQQLCSAGDLLPCYEGPAGTLGVAGCKSGMRTCASGSWGLCLGQVLPAVEACDGVDNDCNPLTADGSAEPLFGQACDGPDGDLCLEGAQVCVGGAFTCSDATGTNLELCNGLDDDCDELVDESCEGSACNDGNPCTHGDAYTGGVCAGTPYSCDDGRSCTADVCNGAGGCTNTLSAGSCLIAGACYGSGQQEAGNPCRSCNPALATGAWSNNDGASCNDGIYCNGNDTCGGGFCTGHAGNPCPGPDGDSNCAETCNETADNCTANDPNGSNCSDGLFCTGVDTCASGACSGHAGNPCPGPDGDSNCAESCNETADNCTGFDPDGSACNDGNPQTLLDICDGSGTCWGE